jgi:chemotaxis protein CheX
MSNTVMPADADLQEIVNEVWESYLDPEGLHPLLPDDPAKATFDAMAAIFITGSWHGHVTFACTGKAARNAAAAFLAMEPAEVTDEDIADVLGEMTNIVGGNVKSMLPQGCFLSLPHVALSQDAITHWPGVVRVAVLSGTWQGESVTFGMWQKWDGEAPK